MRRTDNLAAGVAHEPSSVQQYGAAILNQGKQLADSVERILTFAGGQFGKEKDEWEVVDLDWVVRRAIATVAPAECGVAIEKRVPADLPRVLGDAVAIEQALVNLLTNAKKYGAAGRWIGVSVRNSAGEVKIDVADKGPGIAAVELKRIFEPFYRGSAAKANPHSHGAGLGLTIARRIARAHGGTVTVVTAPGQGSCFTLHLPAM